MAATKRNAMLIEEARFYVYRLIENGEAVYIGKGSGGRLRVQMARFKLAGEIVRRFKSERDAYAYERRLIAELAPCLNNHPGGNGSRAVRRYYRRSADELLIAKIGTRAFAARLLLGVARSAPHLMDLSKLEQIRAVAYG